MSRVTCGSVTCMRCSPRGTLPNIACNTRHPRINGGKQRHVSISSVDQCNVWAGRAHSHSSQLTVSRPITTPREMQASGWRGEKPAAGCSVQCVYRDVGWWGGAATVARRKCFENTSIHSMNLPIKVQQRRAELSTAQPQ